MAARKDAGTAQASSVIAVESARAEGADTDLRRTPDGAGRPDAFDVGQSGALAVRKAWLPRHQRRRHRRAGTGGARHLLHVLQLQGGDLRRGRRCPPAGLPADRRRRASRAGRRTRERTHRACQQGLSQGVRGQRADDGSPGAGGDVQSAPCRSPPREPALLGAARCRVDPSLAGARHGRRTHRSRRMRPAHSGRWSTAPPMCGSSWASPTIATRQSSSSQGCTATRWGSRTTATRPDAAGTADSGASRRSERSRRT